MKKIFDQIGRHRKLKKPLEKWSGFRVFFVSCLLEIFSINNLGTTESVQVLQADIRENAYSVKIQFDKVGARWVDVKHFANLQEVRMDESGR